MKSKKKLISMAVVLIMLAVAATGTLAYFTDAEIAHNVVTSGLIDIELVEKMDDGTGNLVDFDSKKLPKVMPGADVSKIVSVENKSTGDAWIRIKVEKSIIGADGTALDTGVITIHYVEDTKWIQCDDGCGSEYWYYTDPVAPGASTEALFDTVNFSTAMDNSYQGSEINVIVSADAVQVANNPMPASGCYDEIPGWPEPATP